MEEDYRRHNIIGRLLETHLQGRRAAKDSRQFINAFSWIFRTNVSWRTTDYGDWKNTQNRSYCWHDKGICEELFNLVDSFRMPVRAVVTNGTVAGYLEAYREYDTNNVIEQSDSAKIEVLISSKKNRKIPCRYDRNIYESRYQVKNSFLKKKVLINWIQS